MSADLYSLYLAGLVWLLIPVYSSGVARVLPSDLTHLDRAVDIGATLLLVMSIWLGRRGGPFLLNRAVVVHDLGAPIGRRQALTPRLVRQAVAYGALASIGVAGIAAMGEPGTFGYGRAVRHSFVLGLAALTSVIQTVGWLVVWKGHGRSRVLAATLNLLGTIPIVILTVLAISLSSGAGVGLLVAAFVLAAITALAVIEDVPIEHLWRRATALEGMRSAALSFDFQRILVSVRRAVDQTEPRPSRIRLARPWMPQPLWRYLAGFERSWNTRMSQIVLGSVAAALLLGSVDSSNGVGALAVTAAGFVVGFEFASPLAAAAGQLEFSVHYPRGSAPILRAQMVTALALAGATGAACLGWLLGRNRTTGLATVGLFVFGTIASTVQARLGSPDLVGLTQKFGTNVGSVLWIRALLGPLLCFAMTIAVSHGWLRPDGWANWSLLAAAITIGSLYLATYPLEKRLP